MKRSARTHKRKDIFSNPKVQLKIVVVFGVVALLFIVTNYRVVYRLLSDLSNSIALLPLSSQNRADLMMMIEQQEQMLDIQLALFTFLSIFALVIGGVLLSHRIGGPLYQMRRYLDEMAAGTVQPRKITFRKQDFFHDFADSFNAFQQSRGILNKEEAGPHDDPA